ncbi:hypothetical protein C8R43DRAFT_872951, partial [Mycena crocata]
MAYVLEPASSLPEEVNFDSITNAPGIDPMTVTVHKVKLVKNELDFLRAKVDDPHARYEELKHFIDDFSFPKFLRRPPITLIRKIVKQNIISKARALLSLQPIKRADAEDLDRRIKAKVHAETGMPFVPSSDVLTLPIDLHGLDFPSIARINDGIATSGKTHITISQKLKVHRRILARITLADWTCGINACASPIDGQGLTRDFVRYSGKIPYGWIVAQKAMSSLTPTLALKRTEILGILSGEVSLSHVLQTFSNHLPAVPCPNGHALRSLRGKGIRTLNDMGQWRIQVDGRWIVET